MQKRKMLHSGSSRFLRIVFVFVVSAAFALAFPMQSRGGAFPSQEFFFDADSRSRNSTFMDGHLVILSASLSRPYSLDDLAESTFSFESYSRKSVIALSLFYLVHPLYRENRIAAIAAVETPFFLWAGISPLFLRKAPSDYSEERIFVPMMFLSFRFENFLCLSGAGSMYRSSAFAREKYYWQISARRGPLEAGFLVDHCRDFGSDSIFLLSVQTDTRLRFFSSYASGSNELSCGLEISFAASAFEFIFDFNPSLGKSATAGLSKRWLW